MAQIISKICPDLLSLFDIKIKAALIFQSTEARRELHPAGCVPDLAVRYI